METLLEGAQEKVCLLSSKDEFLSPVSGGGGAAQRPQPLDAPGETSVTNRGGGEGEEEADPGVTAPQNTPIGRSRENPAVHTKQGLNK